MGLSNNGDKGRSFRNPSGRTGRIVPDLSSSGVRPGESRSSNRTESSPEVANNLPKPEHDFSWAHVTGSYRREKAIEGLLYGLAVGDALGMGRRGLSRRCSLRLFGRTPLSYCLLPGIGICGADFHRTLMTLQSVLRSRSQLESFRKGFANRLRLSLLTLPASASRITILSAIRLCLGASPSLSGLESSENSPIVSGLALGTVLQGTGHSVEKWSALCTEITHASAEAVEASVLVARAVYVAVMTEPEEFQPIEVIDRLIKITEDSELRGSLQKLREGIVCGWSTYTMADKLGWSKRIPTSAAPTALMAIYSWLINHDSYEQTVTRAILLGGDTETLGAVSGALAGIHLGAKSIPERLRSRLFTWPQGKRWLDAMAKRFVDWPHGSEDLHSAPGLPSRPLMQFARSVILNTVVAIGLIIRAPWRFANRLLGG